LARLRAPRISTALDGHTLSLTMTLLNSSVDLARRRARRLASVAVVAAALSLLLVMISYAFGQPVPWTSWALSVFLLANPLVYLLPRSWQLSRPARAYWHISVAASLIVLVGIIVRFWHR
jgi:hypothetical protein